MSGLFDNQLRLTRLDKKYLVFLNSNRDVPETYILINEHTIGSSNNNFIINENNENILTLNKNHIDFNQQNISFKNINVYNEANLHDIIIDNSLTINNSNINFNNSQIFTESNILFNKDIEINNTYTDKLYVNTIDNINNCNIIIKNLQLSESKFNDPNLINTVSIKSVDNSNIINIDIKDNKNLLHILKVEDLFKITNTGSIIIDNNLQLNKNSLYLSNLSIDNKNCISIGKTKNPIDVIDYNTKQLWDSNNASLLHIHRNDYKEYNIIKDPLLYITTDYINECNIITSNYEQMPLIFSNLKVYIDTNYDETTTALDSYKLFFNFLPNNLDYIMWYKFNNQFNLNNYENTNDNFTSDNPQFNLLVNNYNYNNYKLHVSQIISQDISITDTDITKYNVEMYIGYYIDSNIKPYINDITNTHKINIDDDITNSNNSIYVGQTKIENTNMIDYYKIIESNYNLFPNVCNIYIDFNIHLFYEKSSNKEIIYYIDLTPKTIPCPSIICCEFNTNNILDLNSNGVLTVKDINSVKGNINNLKVSNIDSDVNFENHNLVNINNINSSNIIVDNILAKQISTDDINIIGGNKIIFTEIDTSNFNSDYFKYNDVRTLFLNQFTICNDIINDIDLKQYREQKNISECLITNKNKLLEDNTCNVLYVDGNMIIDGSLQFNRNFKITEKENTLNFLDNINNISLYYGNDILQFGKHFNLLYNNENKIWMGNYEKLMTYSALEETIKLNFNECKIYSETINIQNNGTINFNERYENSFKQFYFNDYLTFDIDRCNIENHSKQFNFNMFGNLRLANTNNDTIIELGDIIDNTTYTMNVFGNIKCCKPFKIELNEIDEKNIKFYNNIALDVQGDGIIKGSLNIDGNLQCQDYIKTEQFIEAKQGVRNISDLRVKEDLKIISNSLEKIKQLSGYTFKRRDLNGIKDTGLIAQDVNKVLPEVINQDYNGYLNIDYSKMMGLIVEAIKELDNKINLIK